MVNLQELEVTRVLTDKNNIFVFIKHPLWWSEYSFLIESDGTVRGKTADGVWLRASQEFKDTLMAKIGSLLIDKPNLIFQ
jgi:hypothetical protein